MRLTIRKFGIWALVALGLSANSVYAASTDAPAPSATVVYANTQSSPNHRERPPRAALQVAESAT